MQNSICISKTFDKLIADESYLNLLMVGERRCFSLQFGFSLRSTNIELSLEKFYIICSSILSLLSLQIYHLSSVFTGPSLS